MEIAELVLKYIEALVWPAVTVGLVWGLRNHIRDAFARMTRLETPAGAIEFETQARQVLSQAEEAAIADSPGPYAPGVPTQRPQPWAPYPAPEPVEEGLGPSAREETPPPAQPQPSQAPQAPQAPQESSPPTAGPWAPPPYAQTNAVEAAPPLWREQLREARTLADASPVGAIITAWSALQSVPKGVVPPHTAELLDQLRSLRNLAMHRPDAVTPEAARSFIESCLLVAQRVQQSR
ncbi:hypothetical protein [Streptomyces botrytidirepellens]|uniref:DUF4145 domain-containing protein n=1 Tax=Streptomyces botrytidirepellens TaxID=2486417 RepID=A0A3M8VTW7_9ACTN|nr:hypothetical protein [Streptomyces botrytidirepellens]RNG21238.1 hypothetical protein EEJ42_22665 [Streptomyces botrytidirepellens]